jgi:hydroxymethylglutaryl-CoA lyase
MKTVKLIECPRDALQSFKPFVSTNEKIAYYQTLLKVGFDTLDCGSFVSPNMIPQMADCADVIRNLDCSNSNTKLLTIVANLRGAKSAVKFKKIKYLGYPFSISENFQIRNTGKTIKESVTNLEHIIKLTCEYEKEVIVYLSMGFGNPYGDPWSSSIILKWIDILANMGIKIISLSDTIGTAKIDNITHLFGALIPKYPELEFGAHFHTQSKSWYDKINAAFNAGCNRFDGTIKGMGSCPMVQNKLIGNIPTEKLISYFTSLKKLPESIDVLAFESAYNYSQKLFN